MLRRTFPTIAILCAAVPSQQDHFVPSTARWLDATGIARSFPGTSLKARQQIVIGASLLATLPAAGLITEVAFRRDGSRMQALNAGSAALVVRASSPAAAVDRLQPVFAGNHGAAISEVFRGTLAFPASPALGDRNQPDWSASHSFTVPFTTPIPYTGGSLCLEIDGTPQTPTSWPIDYHSDSIRGTVLRHGDACGPIAAVTTKTARATDWALRAGSTVQLSVLGEPDSFGVLMLASNLLQNGVDLGFVGSPGCVLRVAPQMTLAAPVRPAVGRPTLPGVAHARIHIPSHQEFVGAQLAAQWANWANGSLFVSDALSLLLAPGAPPLDAATVTSARVDGLPLPAAGRVQIGHLPVLRLRVQ